MFCPALPCPVLFCSALFFSTLLFCIPFDSFLPSDFAWYVCCLWRSGWLQYVLCLGYVSRESCLPCRMSYHSHLVTREQVILKNVACPLFLGVNEQVSVSIDYAYAMTTLTVLCQFFIGLVAIPNPVRWCSSASRSRDPPASLCGANPDGAENFGRGTVVASTNGGERGISRLRSSGSRSSTGGRRRSGSAADENRRNRGNGSAAATAGSLALDPDMFRTTICEPV